MVTQDEALRDGVGLARENVLARHARAMMQRPIISQYVQHVEGHVSARARGANPKAPGGPAH
eukprot:1650111-Pyramimonas_sp.AAC.1